MNFDLNVRMNDIFFQVNGESNGKIVSKWFPGVPQRNRMSAAGANFGLFFSFIWIVSLLIRRRPAVPLSLADHLRTSNRFRLFVIFSWWKGEISCATPQSNWPTFWFADWPFWLTLKWFNSIKLKCWIKAAVHYIHSLFEFHLMRLNMFWLSFKWFNSIKLKCWIKSAVN